MSAPIVAFEELTDSREMLEAKPPAILIVFLYLILVMLLSGIIYMRLGFLDVVIRANGVVRPEGNISFVRNVTSGVIGSLYFKEDDQVKKGDLLYTIDPKSLQVEKDNLTRQSEETERKLESTRLLLKSIQQGQNLVSPADITYYNRYLSQSLETERLQIALLKAEDAFNKEKSLPANMVVKETVQTLEAEYRYAQLALESFQSGQLVQVTEEETTLGDKLHQLSESLRLNTINLEHCQVRAPIDGRIQVLQFYNSGDFLASGAEVIKVIPETDGPLKVELSVSNKDIANLSEGARFRMNIASLPRKEYGIATGLVSTIPGDIAGSNGFYRVEGRLNELVLKGKGKQSAPIRVGMIGDVRIIVRHQRIWDYVMEKLDFKN